MKTTALVLALAFVLPFVLSTGLALAQDGGEGAKKEPFDMEGAIRRVNELLKESERLLVESLRPGTKPGEAAKKVEEAKKAIDELLGESKKNGQQASKVMEDIVKNAPQRPGGGGGGGDQHDSKDDPKDKPKEEDEAKKKDPQNSKQGDPETEMQTEKETTQNPKKELAKKDKPSDPDLAKEWLATLPAEVRKAFENRDWDAIPPRWRERIRKYMKALAETEGGD